MVHHMLSQLLTGILKIMHQGCSGKYVIMLQRLSIPSLGDVIVFNLLESIHTTSYLPPSPFVAALTFVLSEEFTSYLEFVMPTPHEFLYHTSPTIIQDGYQRSCKQDVS